MLGMIKIKGFFQVLSLTLDRSSGQRSENYDHAFDFIL